MNIAGATERLPDVAGLHDYDEIMDAQPLGRKSDALGIVEQCRARCSKRIDWAAKL